MFDLESIKRKLLIKYPFFGSVIANVQYKEDASISTAATDGEVIYYSSDYLNSINLDKQLFIFAHEVCHIAFNHILRSENKDIDLWNTATDAVINAFLMKDGLEIIDGGVNMPEAIYYDAEQLYEKLLNEKNNSCKECNNSDEKSESSNNSSSNEENKSNDCSGSSSDSDNQSNNDKSEEGTSEESNNDFNNSDTNSSHSSMSDNLDNSNDNTGEQESNDSSNKSENSNESGNDSKDGSSSSDKEPDGEDENSNIDSSKSSSSNSESKEENSNDDMNSSEQSHKEDDDSKNSSNEKDEEFSNSNHSLWKDAVKKHKEENEKNNSSEELKKKHDEKEDVSEKEAFKQNREEKKKQLYDMKRMIIEETPIAGEDTNEESFSIDESGTLKPIFDWRYVLKTNTQFDYDWSYRNSYIEDGVIDSRLEEQPFCETEILLDTSGSIEETMLRNFIMECKNILQVSRLKIGCFDTKFYGFNEIRTIDDLKNMDFIGRGGTDFNCAVNAFSFRVDNRIIFTDGYADMPNKPMDIVWMVYGDKKINPKGGQVYYVTQEQLERLCCIEREKVLKKYR